MNNSQTHHTSPLWPAGIFFLCALLIAVACYAAFKNINENEKKDASKTLASIGQLKANQIQLYLMERTEDAAVVSSTLTTPLAQHWLTHHAGNAPAILNQLAESVVAAYQYRGLLLLDAEANIRLNVGHSGILTEAGKAIALHAMGERSPVSFQIYFGDPSTQDEPVLDTFVPVMSRDGTVAVGMIVLRSELKFLFQLLQTWPVESETAETLLFTRDGNDVLFLNELRHYKGAAARFRIPLSTDTNAPAWPAISAATGHFGLLEANDYRGKRVLAYTLPVPGTPWSMMAKMDVEEAEAHSQRLLRIALIVATILIVATGIIVWLWWRKDKVDQLANKQLREGEARYRRFHDSMMDAYAMVDMSGHIIDFNRAYMEMLGYSAGELQRKTYADMTPDKWHDLDARIVEEQVIPHGYSQVYEKEYIRKDGMAFPVELKISLLRDADNRPEAMWAIVRDITGRKQTEDSLRKSEAMLRESQRMAQIGSWELDLVNNVLSWSDENYRIFEIDRTRFGASYEAFLNTIHPDDRAMVNQAYTSSVKNRTPYDIVHRLLFPDQRVKYAREWCETIYDQEGRPIRSIGTTQDVTVHKLAEDALRASENRYRLLIESSPFCIHEIDLEGRLQSMNKAGLDMLGLDEVTKIRGVPYLGAVSQQDAGRVGILLRDAIDNGTASHFEFAAAGEVQRYFKSCFIPIKDADGKVLKLMGITEDITESKTAEEMLHFHSKILKSLMEGIYLIRASDGMIVFANPQFERMFGYDPGELFGKHMSIVNAPGEKSAEATADAIMSELARAGVWSGEVQNIRKDGTTFWCHASVSAFDHPQFGHVWVSVHEDITERKQFEEMRAKMESTGRFNIAGETAASLTHELSQPLTACNNYLDVCLRRIDEQDWSRERLKEALQLAHKQAGRAGEIINHFKKQVRRQEFEYTLFDVNLLAREVLDFLAGEIKRQGISMHMVLFTLPQVMACREEIRQVLLSLCENAIEAMHSSLQRELYVTTRIIDSSHVMVGVSDSGEGVLPDRMKTLFEPFQTSREGGLGLSLSICRSIIEKHGGRIWADTKRESGAEFYFTLPIQGAS